VAGKSIPIRSQIGRIGWWTFGKGGPAKSMAKRGWYEVLHGDLRGSCTTGCLWLLRCALLTRLIAVML
jgi:hypothetical protein